VLRAVLFDWGDTLMRWAWEPELLAVGHDAGLRAIGREPAPAMTERFRDAYLPLLWAPGTLEEVEYPGVVRKLLGEEGIEVDDAELDLFLEAEHAAWQPARMLATTTQALLEALRDRDLKVGLVSNAVDPPALLHRDLEQMGIAQRLDVAVFSSEVGWRKPHPAIFARALEAVGSSRARRSSSATRSPPTSPALRRSACIRARRCGSAQTRTTGRPSPSSAPLRRWT
jgi:putative hydrolase of the HAD superfamily